MNLIEYVKQVSQEDFGKEFTHQAFWNKRLRTTGGRFFPNDGHLDFNPRIYEEYGLEIFRKIVRHELVHYHLYYEAKGYRHQDKDFKQLLQEVDGLRYAPRLASNSRNLLYQCQRCKIEYNRKRFVDISRYRCGKCQGRLKLVREKT